MNGTRTSPANKDMKTHSTSTLLRLFCLCLSGLLILASLIMMMFHLIDLDVQIVKYSGLVTVIAGHVFVKTKQWTST